MPSSETISFTTVTFSHETCTCMSHFYLYACEHVTPMHNKLFYLFLEVHRVVCYATVIAVTLHRDSKAAPRGPRSHETSRDFQETDPTACTRPLTYIELQCNGRTSHLSCLRKKNKRR